MLRVYFFLIFCLFLFTGCDISLPTLGSEKGEISDSGSMSHTGSSLQTSTGGGITSSGTLSGVNLYQKSVDTSTKAEQSKRRQSLTEIIRKGDFFALRNDPETALAYYQESIKQVPDDLTLKKKIANIHYSMKNWNEAYQLYIQVPFNDLTVVEQYRMYTALFFGSAVTDRLTELRRIPGLPEMTDYYTMVDTCYTGIHNCVVALEAYTGGVENVVKLRDSMKGYEKISDDFQYRNLLLVAELYKQGQYRASSILAREVYDKRPDYYANLKILGFSLYELGRYEEAKNLLEDYYRENPKDIDVIYVLGEIAFFLHDPLTSNMYLNNAVTGGYSKKTDIERRMAYNYYTLMDIDGMVKVLGYLIAEPDATEDDFSIATYVSVTQGDSERALTWVDDGIAKFPQSDRLYALRARALRTLGRLDEAEMSAQQAYVLDGTNALAMLELGYIRASHHSYADARDFLTRMLEVSGDSTFADEAQSLLADIENQENSQVEVSSLVSEGENLPASVEGVPDIPSGVRDGPGGSVE